MNQVKGNGASSTVFEHSRPNDVKRSRFDLSRIKNLTCDVGQIIPVDCFEVLPGDVVNLDSELILDTLPLVQSSLTQYKVTTHWYYMKARDLWKGAKTQATRGRSGNVSLSTPVVDLDLPLSGFHYYDTYKGVFVSTTGSDGEISIKIHPQASHSLSAFLGIPPSLQGIYKEVSGTTNTYIDKAYLPYSYKVYSSNNWSTSYANAVATGFSDYRYANALPFVMYQSIVKNNYVPQNLLQDNHSLFPVEGDDDWLLPYNATVTNFIDYASNDEITTADKYSYTGVFTSADTVTRLDQLRYACFDDDYFTTGLPWLQRGDVTTLDLSATVSVDRIPVQAYYTGGSNVYTDVYPYVNTDVTTFGGYGFGLKSSLPSSLLDLNVPLSAKLSDTSIKASTNLTANELRSLLAMSVWQERNARVNGSYNAMIFQHWNIDPNSEEHKPVYIGGSVDYINFSTVIQNSQSTDSSPLGSTAGFGSTGGKSTINNAFKCSDYGYIMGIMIVKPVTYYQQGVERYLCCKNAFEDIVQPEFQNLSPEPIYNKELYVSGDDSIDNDLFGYQERYTYLKVRQNVNCGLFQSKPSKDLLFGSFTQARWFDSLPKLSYQFLCMSPDNIRRDWLAYPSYPAFRVQFMTKCFVNRALAYTSEPNTFGF